MPEQILKHSVNALCLPIRLWMEGSAGELLDTQTLAQPGEEPRHELGASIVQELLG
jgi:hypothetical protein